MVISILTVWECDENTFQSSKSIFLGTRGYSLKFERSENFKEAPRVQKNAFTRLKMILIKSYCAYRMILFYILWRFENTPAPLGVSGGAMSRPPILPRPLNVATPTNPFYLIIRLYYNVP